jgi:hypothetical protein
MKSREAQLIDTLTRVAEFLEKNHAVVDGVIPLAARENFFKARARVTQHMRLQDAFTRGLHTNVGAKRVLRDDLIREHLLPISVVARTCLPAAGENSAFRLPKATRKFLVYVAAGYGMAEAAKPHEPTLLAAGLPADFIARLVAATELLDRSLSAKGETVSLRAEATAGLTKDGRAARRALRILDVLVRAAIKEDNTLLDRWANASRVAKVAVSATPVGEEPPGGSLPPSDGSSGGDDAPGSSGGITPSLPEATATT